MTSKKNKSVFTLWYFDRYDESGKMLTAHFNSESACGKYAEENDSILVFGVGDNFVPIDTVCIDDTDIVEQCERAENERESRETIEYEEITTANEHYY